MPKPKFATNDNTMLVPYNFNKKLDLGCKKFKGINTLIFAEPHNKSKCSMFNVQCVNCFD